MLFLFQEYVAVDPSDYTTEFVDIQDSTKNNMRPLGYTKASYIFEGSKYVLCKRNVRAEIKVVLK